MLLTGLEEVYIGENVTSIGSYAFEKDTNIKKLYIGGGVTKINQFAFSGCTSLDDITINNSEGTIKIDTTSFKDVPAYTNGTIKYLK